MIESINIIYAAVLGIFNNITSELVPFFPKVELTVNESGTGHHVYKTFQSVHNL